MDISTKQSLAIKKINPNAEFAILDEDLDNINWINDTTPISKADIESKYTQVEFEYYLEELRFKRNRLLSETDYFALSDVSMSDDMTTYRQALRDLTNGLTTKDEVESVSWPTKP
nr:putative tail assembly chaperone [uncultured Mediterranean phage uvMED]